MTLLHRPAPAAPDAPDRAVLSARSGSGPARAVQLATTISRVAVLVALVVGLTAPGWTVEHQTWVLGAGFLLGLPHGAVDHLIPLRHGWVRRGPVGLAGVVVAYVALAALAYAGLRFAGPVVLPVLLAVSVLHFGYADLETAGADRRPRGLARLLEAAGRGGAVLAGPLLAWPGPTGAALATVGLGVAPSRTTGIVVAVVLLGVALVAAVQSLRRRSPADAVEVVLLVALFVVLPPLAAFGVYFGLWHGLRHTARLVADDPAGAADLVAGRLLRPLGRFVVAAALPSLAALTTVLVLVRLAADRADLVGPVFAALLALTVPHVVVVALWDHQTDRPGQQGRARLT